MSSSMSDTTWQLMLYIACDTNGCKRSYLSIILKIGTIFDDWKNWAISLCKSAGFCIRYTTFSTAMISFVFSSWIINEYYKYSIHSIEYIYIYIYILYIDHPSFIHSYKHYKYIHVYFNHRKLLKNFSTNC